MVDTSKAMRVRVKVNGEVREAEVPPRLLLVDFLRDVLKLKGTHVGCDTSSCGACTVLLDGLSVQACTLFAVQVHGRELVTIEGLSKDGDLHPIQQAFWDRHGSQCGYCTPGMILSAHFLLSRNPRPTESEIRRGIAGNICRCTGYKNIVHAIGDAAEAIEKSKRRE